MCLYFFFYNPFDFSKVAFQKHVGVKYLSTKQPPKNDRFYTIMIL